MPIPRDRDAGDGPQAARPPAQPAPMQTAAPRARRTLRMRWLTPLLLVLIGVVGGLTLFTALQSDPAPPTAAEVVATVASMQAEARATPEISATVYQTILPSLVYIQAVRKAAPAGGDAIGSGVVVNADGTILTANHVVAGAQSIMVTFVDGTRVAAEVVDTQPEKDLATLKAASGPQTIVPAVLGGGVQVGDLAFAVGNPLGLSGSLSAGVVSGLDRTFTIGQDGRRLSGLIQFDAAVNPGSSGGPLLNRNGQVVGIVTALANASSQESFSGIGFAVPLSAAGGAGGPPR